MDLKDLFGENSPERVILKAQRLAARGRNDQAVAVIKDALGRLGENTDLRIELATLHLAGGRPREAAESLRALLKADSRQCMRVEEFIGWARTQFSEIEPLWEPLAEGHIARRNYGAAVDCLERIQRKSLEGALEQRLSNLNRFLEKGGNVPKSAVPVLYFAALGYEAIGDWQKSVECYRKIVSAVPNDFIQVDERLKGLVGRHYKTTALRLAHADLLDAQGQPARAWEEYLTALEIDPRCAPQVSRYVEARLEPAQDDPDLMWALVRVRLAEGRIPEAMEICGRLAEKKLHLPEIEKMLDGMTGSGKESVETQLLLGKVSIAQGKVPRALSAIVAALGNDAGQRGIEALESLVTAHPGEARPYQVLADFHLKEGRVERSLELFRALRRVDPSASPAIATRLQAVLTADPGNGAARDLLEEVCIEAGDIQSAGPFLRRRIREGPEAARDAVGRLRSMLLASPADEGLKLAAAEGCIATGEPAAAWGYLQDLLDAARPLQQGPLHLMVLCAGASPELFRRVASDLASRGQRGQDRPEMVFALAEAAGRAGLFREAVERFRAVASSSPEAVAVCHAAIRSLGERAGSAGGEDRAALAEAMLDAGDLDTAILILRGTGALPAASAGRLVERFTAALRADPKNVSLSAGLAEVCLASGQVARALEIARAGIVGREDAASAPLTLTYGDALMKASKPAEATRAYAAAARRDPGLSAEVIERLQRVVQVDVGQDTAQLALGRLLIHVDRLDEGVAALLTAWSIKAELGPVVIKDLERASRRRPGLASVDFAMSQIHLSAGDPVAAAEAVARQIGGEGAPLEDVLARLEEIAARHPSCGKVQLELGRAYLQKRWATRACICLSRSYELDRGLAESVLTTLGELQKQFPEVPEAHVARGIVCEGERRALPAAEAYARAAGLGGTGGAGALAGLRRLCSRGRAVPPRVHLLRSKVCGQMGEVAEAVEAARSALQTGSELAGEVRAELDHLVSRHPFSAIALLGRAAALIRAVDPDGATRDLTDALRFDPASTGTVTSLAREILSADASHLGASRVLAEALHLSGDVAGAARALDTALATKQGGSDLELLLARRSLALTLDDQPTARALLSRAERAAPDRDRLLESLHREAMKGVRQAADETADPIGEAIGRGDYHLAAELTQGQAPSARIAWVLERCGRYAEAAACLELLIGLEGGQEGSQGGGREGAAQRYAGLHDQLVARELEGKAPALLAETRIQFDTLTTSDAIAPRALQAGEAVQGGSA